MIMILYNYFHSFRLTPTWVKYYNMSPPMLLMGCGHLVLYMWAKPIHSAGGDQHDANYPPYCADQESGSHSPN